jgi:murein DD-endopeptidase MepM/ murein hydrolase activator NlpD
MDIVRVNAMGRVVNTWLPYSEKLEDYPGFGTELFSPCDGIVLRVEDGIEDLPPGQLPPRNTAGNLVLLGHHRCKILMGHFKKGSVRVREGDTVSRGQLLGQLGNSGHSTFPHLHISFAVGGTDRGLYDGTGVAVKFDGKYLVRNSLMSASPTD